MTPNELEGSDDFTFLRRELVPRSYTRKAGALFWTTILIVGSVCLAAALGLHYGWITVLAYFLLVGGTIWTSLRGFAAPVFGVVLLGFTAALIWFFVGIGSYPEKSDDFRRIVRERLTLIQAAGNLMWLATAPRGIARLWRGEPAAEP